MKLLIQFHTRNATGVTICYYGNIINAKPIGTIVMHLGDLAILGYSLLLV